MSDAFTVTATENNVEEIKNYKTKELVDFLRAVKGLDLSEKVLKTLVTQEVNGLDFLNTSKEEFIGYGIPGGPAKRLTDFVKKCIEKKPRNFSTYKTKKDLSDVLRKYGIDDDGITTIEQFPPKKYSLDDDDEDLKQCIKEIKRRINNMGSVAGDSNEAVRCEYISVILHASLYIVKRVTKKNLTLKPNFEVVGKESTGRVDYAIKSLEELICITGGESHQVRSCFAQNLVQCESALQVNKKKRTVDNAFKDDFDYIYGIVTTAIEWYFILYTPKKIFCTSKVPIYTPFLESALKENSEDEKEMCKNVKRVMEIIVGLLKNRVEVEKEPMKKKTTG